MNDDDRFFDGLLRRVTSTPAFVATICLLPIVAALLRFSFLAFLVGFLVLGCLAGAIIGTELGILDTSGPGKGRYGFRTFILGVEFFALLLVILKALPNL